MAAVGLGEGVGLGVLALEAVIPLVFEIDRVQQGENLLVGGLEGGGEQAPGLLGDPLGHGLRRFVGGEIDLVDLGVKILGCLGHEGLFPVHPLVHPEGVCQAQGPDLVVPAEQTVELGALVGELGRVRDAQQVQHLCLRLPRRAGGG